MWRLLRLRKRRASCGLKASKAKVSCFERRGLLSAGLRGYNGDIQEEYKDKQGCPECRVG